MVVLCNTKLNNARLFLIHNFVGFDTVRGGNGAGDNGSGVACFAHVLHKGAARGDFGTVGSGEPDLVGEALGGFAVFGAGSFDTFGALVSDGGRDLWLRHFGVACRAGRTVVQDFPSQLDGDGEFKARLTAAIAGCYRVVKS